MGLIDGIPDVFLPAIQNLVSRFEDPTGLDRPLWGDVSKYQGDVNFAVLRQAGFLGFGIRSNISWGYVDPKFKQNWDNIDRVRQSLGVSYYRTPYCVIYTDQLPRYQVENWVKTQPKIDVIPRVIDLELDRAPASVTANCTWEVSERLADIDGVRPLIYSRYLLVNKWLVPYWSQEKLNEHFWWLAQYLWDRVREHPGEPIRPKGVSEDNVLLHQTADKKAPPYAAVESASLDYDRWERGNEAEMHLLIQELWGGDIVSPPMQSWAHDIDAWARTLGFQSPFPPPSI